MYQNSRAAKKTESYIADDGEYMTRYLKMTIGDFAYEYVRIGQTSEWPRKTTIRAPLSERAKDRLDYERELLLDSCGYSS